MTTKKRSAAAAVTPEKKSPAKTTKTRAKPAAKAPAGTLAAALPGQADKKAKKNHKEKVVRDSFTMPKSEYQKIAEIKEACLVAGMHVKKSEILRAGLKALGEKNDAQLRQSLRSLDKIQTGRPKKH